MGGKRTILLVDDNFMNRRLVGAMLNGGHYLLIEKENGRDGLAYLLANRETVDLVLLDVGMPDLDGTDICRAVRGIEDSGNRLPIIAYTAHAMAGEQQSLFDAGFDDILIKPITRDDFLPLLERHLGEGKNPGQEFP